MGLHSSFVFKLKVPHSVVVVVVVVVVLRFLLVIFEELGSSVDSGSYMSKSSREQLDEGELNRVLEPVCWICELFVLVWLCNASRHECWNPSQ